MRKCHIIGAGDFSPRLFKKEIGDLVIAADAGLLHLNKMGLIPDLFVGDGDSLGKIPSDLDRIVLPCEKDDTDLLNAIRQGLKRDYREFCLYGALGGKRISHTLANISLLLFLEQNDASGTLIDENYSLSLLPKGAHSFSFAGGYFSLFALEESCLSVKGAKYPLEQKILSPDFPLGVSNEGSENTLITVHSGKVLLVREP